MNRWLWLGFSIGIVAVAHADVMTLVNGKIVGGSFTGFSNRKFDFQSEDAGALSEYPLNVASIVLEAPVPVSVKLIKKQYDYIDFVGFDHNTLRLRKDGKSVDESVLMLKALSVGAKEESHAPVTSADTVASEPASEPAVESPIMKRAAPPPVVEAAVPPKTKPYVPSQPAISAPRISANERQWTRSDKWREIPEDAAQIISRGEVVNVETSLRKGYVNIVHFHMPSSVPSMREGNYIQSLASKRSDHLVVWKVLITDFRAPICSALDLKSLPQFWFYDAQGQLVTKLTDRFTENDIDAAIKSARIGKIP